jgi:GAF domain-containing protein
MPERTDDQTSSAAAWWHARLSEDHNVHAALRRIAEAGCHLVAGCAAASVTIIERGRPITVVSTADSAIAADVAQHAAGDGPCLTAARERRPVLVDDIELDDRWPGYRLGALAEGLAASLSLPLDLGSCAHGVLNLYAERAGAFTRDDQHLALGFAAQASIVIVNAQAYWSAIDTTRNLTAALESRAIIEQAKGILIARHGCSDDDAFLELRHRSQTTARKLHAVAAELVDAARHDARR